MDRDENETLVLQQPKFVQWVGIICMVFFAVLFVWATVISGEAVGFVFLVFLPLGLYLVVYSSCWKITLTGTKMVVCQAGKSPQALDIMEIDRVAEEHNGIRIYRDGRKLVDVESWVKDFGLLYQRLDRLGKMDSMKNRNSFAVGRNNGQLVVGVICLVLFGIGAVCSLAESETLAVFILGVFTLISACMIIAPLRWRLEVTGNQLTYQTALSAEKTIPLRDIQRVVLTESGLSLMSDGKTIIRVARTNKEYATLVRRLEAENLPFYRDKNPV